MRAHCLMTAAESGAGDDIEAATKQLELALFLNNQRNGSRSPWSRAAHWPWHAMVNRDVNRQW
jgi:hypothetical protein